MDKPISVGDLVMVVRTRCCPNLIGTVYQVTIITNDPREQECSECGTTLAADRSYEDSVNCYFGDELKRIPPLGEIEGAKDAADKPITLDGEIERLRKLVSA